MIALEGPAIESSPQLTQVPSKPFSSAGFPTRHVLLLLAVAACLFFAGLGRLPLFEPDEGRNAEVAREMLSSGDWITPHFNTLTYLDKPVFFFWLVTVSFRLWGISEWAARFPSAIMALAVMLIAWLLARRMFGDKVGLWAGIVLATTPLVIALSREVTFDMTLTCFVSLSMLCFWWAEARPTRPHGLDGLAFAAMGVATITKGPVGFLLPILGLLAYYALRRRLGDLKRIHWGLGLVIFLLTTLPWFLTVSIRNPDFPRYAFWQESLLRVATSHARRPGGVLYYVPVYLAGFFPWSFFLVFAGLTRVRRWRELAREAHRPVAFLLSWVGVIFVFFSISRSKLPVYFLPATVPLSILMAQGWSEFKSEAGSRSPSWLKAGFGSLIGVGLVVATASQLFLLRSVQARVAAKIPAFLMPSVQLSTLFTGLIILAQGILGIRLAVRARSSLRHVSCFALLALTVPVLAIRWIVPLERFAEIASSRQIAKIILSSSEKNLPLYGYYYFRTSLPFYLQRPVGLVTGGGSELTSNYIVARFEELRRQKPRWGPAGTSETMTEHALVSQGSFGPVLIDSLELRALARSPQAPLLVMARNTHISDLAQTVGSIESLWGGRGYSVWKVPGRESEARK